MGTALALALFASAPGAETAQNPICTSIRASQSTPNTVKITWTVPKDARMKAGALLLFRSDSPLNSLDGLEPRAELPSFADSFHDKIEKYGDYYYAVAVKEEGGGAFPLLVPESNVTVKPVRLRKTEVAAQNAGAGKTYKDGQMRERPLPFIDMFDLEFDFSEKKGNISAETTEIARELAGIYADKRVVLAPHVFDEDLMSSASGDDYFLFEILKDHFIKKDYKKSEEKLLSFLAVNRPRQIADRATFYLGEARYFSGDYKGAIESFLQVGETRSALARKWIDSSLDLYKISD